jgi:hypothetical protein
MVRDLLSMVPVLVRLELRFPWRAGTPAPAPVLHVSAATFTFATCRDAILAAPRAALFWAVTTWTRHSSIDRRAENP